MPSSSSSSSKVYSPLPLEDLQGWVTTETLEWLEQGDIKAAAFQAELEAEGADQIVDLFANENDGDNSVRSDADFEGYYGRIRVWMSSSNNINGVGGMYINCSSSSPEESEGQISNAGPHSSSSTTNTSENDDGDPNAIRIVYIISESWEGYGDLLWASARYLANHFADPSLCQELLDLRPSWNERPREASSPGSSPASSAAHHCHHPLRNKRVLELGAGCGVPSLVAMKCGARVVCTDVDDANRIRSLAEAVQRNWEEDLQVLPKKREKPSLQPNNAHLARVCPLRWGGSPAPVLKCLNPQMVERFDIICATDCLFMPWLHYDLLKSIDELMELNGVAIIAFCIHEAFSKDDEVWPFCDKAEEKGFHVQILPSAQLTPPRKGMDAKQGLVNVLRLTRKQLPV